MAMNPEHLRAPAHARAQLERDAALRRTARARKLAYGGAAVLTAGCAGLVAEVAPGHTLHAHATGLARTTVPVPNGAVPTTPKLPPLASPSALGLQAPVSAPGASSASGQAAAAQAAAAANAAAAAAQQQQLAAEQQQLAAAAAASSAAGPSAAVQGAPVVSGGS
jgi:hypothetical protein